MESDQFHPAFKANKNATKYPLLHGNGDAFELRMRTSYRNY